MKGKCYYCNKDLTERTIKRHIKSCPVIKEKINEEINTSKGTRNQFIISIKPKYDKSTYCIYLSIDENLQLQHLDKFIRDVWVECCGHLSSFTINGMRYNDNSNDLYQMNVKLKEVLSIGEKFDYEYDFGDTTYLILEVIDNIKVSKNHSQIEILARNNENHYVCCKCGDKAEYYQYTIGDFLCEKCAHKLDEYEFENEIEELYGEYFNSPRDGVCGYVGDRDAEMPYMPENNNKYKTSKQKPQLEDDEYDYWENDDFDFMHDSLYENDLKNDDLLYKLLDYAYSGNDITEDNINNILQEHFSELQSNFEEAFHNFAEEIIKKFEKGVFSFDLHELLNAYTKTQLKELAHNFDIKIPSSSNKNTYINKLIGVYSNCIRNEIYKMDENKYKKLQKCVKNKGLVNDTEENINNYMFFVEKGILFPAIHDEKPIFIMPDIIQEVFKETNTLEVRNKIKNNTEIINLFRGMIKAYGILSYDDTIKLLKRYITDFDEINAIYILKENENYYFSEYEVVEEEDGIFSEDEIKLFVNSKIDDYDEVLLEINNKMEYSYISKDKLIAMSDIKYLEKSAFGKKFLKEISHIFVITKDEAIYNMNMLALDIQTRSIKEILKDVISGIDFHISKEDKFIVEQIFTEFSNNIPLWKFRGATMKQQNKPKQEYNISNKKIGRNELCPCGSGKKYKNCCGKVINLF